MADILLVDDDADGSWLLEQLLSAAGHAVRTGHDGLEGLSLLQKRRPDLALLDVEMPRMDGPTMAYRMFVHDVGLENIPLILLSGVADLEAVAHRVGTPYFMSKPVDVQALLALVTRALEERHLPVPVP